MHAKTKPRGLRPPETITIDKSSYCPEIDLGARMHPLRLPTPAELPWIAFPFRVLRLSFKLDCWLRVLALTLLTLGTALLVHYALSALYEQERDRRSMSNPRSIINNHDRPDLPRPS